MYALLVVGLLALGVAGPKKPPAKTPPTTTATEGAAPKPPADLPMPPPPATKPAPKPGSATKPAPSAAVEPPLTPQTLLRRITVGGAVGPSFGLSGSSSFGSTGGDPSWLRAVVQATFDAAAVGPVRVHVVLPIGLQGTSARFLTTVINVSALDIMPSGRVTYELMPKVVLYGDLGLGLQFMNSTAMVQYVGYQSYGITGSGLRLAGGVQYQLLPALKLFAEPISLMTMGYSVTITNPNGGTITASGSGAQWSLLAGATYQL